MQSQNTPNPSPKDRSLDRGEGGRSFAGGWPDGKETVISGMLRVSADRRRPRSVAVTCILHLGEERRGRMRSGREEEREREVDCDVMTRLAALRFFASAAAATRTDKHDRKIEILLHRPPLPPSVIGCRAAIEASVA